MFNVILFDLDGTLTDPYTGIANSVIYALGKFGIEAPPRKQLKRFIGPPLTTSFSEFYGFSQTDAAKAVGYYREYYEQRGMLENSVISGTENVLAELSSCGKRLLVATSKPEKYAVQILDHFHLSRYFQSIVGATMDYSRVEKSDIIKYALEKSCVSDLSTAIMVGDRKHDVIGAKENGLKSVGVLYGYGSKEELLMHGADYLAKAPADIIKIVK